MPKWTAWVLNSVDFAAIRIYRRNSSPVLDSIYACRSSPYMLALFDAEPGTLLLKLRKIRLTKRAKLQVPLSNPGIQAHWKGDDCGLKVFFIGRRFSMIASEIDFEIQPVENHRWGQTFVSIARRLEDLLIFFSPSIQIRIWTEAVRKKMVGCQMLIEMTTASKESSVRFRFLVFSFFFLLWRLISRTRQFP